MAAAPATDSGMTFPIVNDITTLDTDGNGYIDRVYAADLGGNLWRFDVGATSIASWTGKKIFSANPASGSDTGRKIFYKPAVTLEAATTDTTRGSDALIFMGSGDREHPTNTAVLDRMYAVRDKGQTTTKYESDLVDVTTDQLQAATGSQATIDAAVNAVLTSLSSATKYGWYIQLNQNSGEKVLAPPAINNRIAYFTTFTPGSSVNVDPCSPSNMGTSRLYVLNYATGEAVMNYDTTNDSTTTANKRAQAKPGGEVLLRSDRVKSLGSGIASGVIIVRDKAFIGCGGGICTEAVKSGSSGRIINLYWMQK